MCCADKKLWKLWELILNSTENLSNVLWEWWQRWWQHQSMHRCWVEDALVSMEATFTLFEGQTPKQSSVWRPYPDIWWWIPEADWGISASIPPSAPPGGPPSPVSAAHARLSIPGRKSRTQLRESAGSIRVAGCFQLWNRQKSHSRCGVLVARRSPTHRLPPPPPQPQPWTALWPGSGELSAGKTPFSRRPSIWLPNAVLSLHLPYSDTVGFIGKQEVHVS